MFVYLSGYLIRIYELQSKWNVGKSRSHCARCFSHITSVYDLFFIYQHMSYSETFIDVGDAVCSTADDVYEPPGDVNIMDIGR